MSNTDLLALPGVVGTDGKTNDIAYRWLEVLFATDTNSGFGAAFSTFTSMLGLLGALFLGWHIVIGIVSSAYSGKVLGEKYHQIWAPVRVVVGFGMMIPIAGGFSSVHYILKEVVGRAAVNMGNAPIVAYVKHLGQYGGDIHVSSLSGGAVVRDVIDREICVALRNGVYRASWFGVSGEISLPASAQKHKIGYDPREAVTNSVYTTTWSWGSCGTLGFKTSNKDSGSAVVITAQKLENFHVARDKATAELIDDFRKAFPDEAQTKFGDYFGKKSYEGKSGLETSAALEKAGILPKAIGPLMESLASDWNKKVAAAVKEAFSDEGNKKKQSDALAERIEKYGFMVAGSYERELSKIAGATASLANAQPYKTIPSPGSSYDDALTAALQAVYSARNLDGKNMAETGTQQALDGGDVFSSLFGSIISFRDAPTMDQLSVDPVGGMIARGQWFLTVASALIAGMTALHGMAGSAKEGSSSGAVGLFGGGFIGGAIHGTIMYLSQWANYAILILLGLGILHTWVLPLIPMIMVFIMGMSWLIMFLEASIAAVLWAFAFIRMDGSEFFDRNQAPGATLVFNLFLRPAIGMLAFIGGLLLLPTLLGSLAMIWDESFYAQTDNGAWDYINLAKYLVSWIIFCWMQWHLTLRLFGLVPTIADRVGHWMGFQGGNGYNDGGETQGATAAMVGAGMAMSRAPIVPTSVGGGGGRGRGPSGDSGGGGGAAGGIPVGNLSSGGGTVSAVKGEKGDNGERGRDGRDGK